MLRDAVTILLWHGGYRWFSHTPDAPLRFGSVSSPLLVEMKHHRSCGYPTDWNRNWSSQSFASATVADEIVWKTKINLPKKRDLNLCFRLGSRDAQRPWNPEPRCVWKIRSIATLPEPFRCFVNVYLSVWLVSIYETMISDYVTTDGVDDVER